MRARRMIVAFEQIEGPQSRMWRQMGAGLVTDEDLKGKKARLGRYWCAADKPEQDDDFKITPVYRTNVVPENAQCEQCGIGIRELQAELRKFLP